MANKHYKGGAHCLCSSNHRTHSKLMMGMPPMQSRSLVTATQLQINRPVTKVEFSRMIYKLFAVQLSDQVCSAHFPLLMRLCFSVAKAGWKLGHEQHAPSLQHLPTWWLNLAST